MENINYLAILLSGIAAMVVGFLWYGNMLFGKQWMKEIGTTEAKIKENSKDMPKTYGLMFLGALVQAYVLSMFISYAGVTDYVGAAMVAFFAWLGFVVVTRSSDVLFERKTTTLFGINIGYTLVTLIVMSAIIITI